MRLLHHDARREPLAELSRFRGKFSSCLTARSDARFELADGVLCGDGPVRPLVELSLAGEHRRGHGGLYAAVAPGSAAPSACPWKAPAVARSATSPGRCARARRTGRATPRTPPTPTSPPPSPACPSAASPSAATTGPPPARRRPQHAGQAPAGRPAAQPRPGSRCLIAEQQRRTPLRALQRSPGSARGRAHVQTSDASRPQPRAVPAAVSSARASIRPRCICRWSRTAAGSRGAPRPEPGTDREQLGGGGLGPAGAAHGVPRRRGERGTSGELRRGLVGYRGRDRTGHPPGYESV